MNAQRCPECGQRLSTNYCDICMRKVPFGGVKLAKRRDPWDSRDGSSAHRREKGHECISFGDEKQPKKTTYRSYRKTTNKKGASVVAIILAIFSLLSAAFSLVEEAVDSVAVSEPEYYSAEGFVEAGTPGAEEVPNVLTGEIYNANGIRITADRAGLSYGEYVICFRIDNDTNRKISVNFENISANGFLMPQGAYQEVKAGKSNEISIAFYSDELEKAGIKQVSEVAFDLYAYESNGYDDIVEGELVTVQTEADDTQATAVDTSGLELYNDGSLLVVLRDINLTDYGECELELYMENLSGNSVEIYSEEVLLNGEEVSGYIWEVLRPDTRAINNGIIYGLDGQADLGVTELEQIKEITIGLYVDYKDGWDIVESYSESVTFDPNAIP